ncbi:ATP-binding protein [Cellulomonas sp. NS3]|uniref:ATP-binding protein n=1 Tax=Cellulomonas sp. NS3 TaxID=2973977 RepID=UPI002162BF4E|nr:ATP-binding protein [Cellulomonas sp. NS3]
MQVAAKREAARLGRRWTRRIARTYGADDSTVQLVELLTSEVVTNAVKYGQNTGPIDIDVQCHDDTLTIAVSDDNPTPPTLKHRPPHVPGGRGIQLLERLTTEWGWRPQAHGKSVWFTVALP